MKQKNLEWLGIDTEEWVYEDDVEYDVFGDLSDLVERINHDTKIRGYLDGVDVGNTANNWSWDINRADNF